MFSSFLSSSKLQHGRLARWAFLLQEYNYPNKYHYGFSHVYVSVKTLPNWEPQPVVFGGSGDVVPPQH